MESAPIQLPILPPPARRPPLPIVAALVPVVAGAVLWGVTGSLITLCFAALGPLMLLASLFDGARARRRERRSQAEESARGWALAEDDLSARQRELHRSLWQRLPDALSGLQRPPLYGADAVDEHTELVVGRGAASSGIRASGGEGEQAREFRRRCGVIEDAPIAVPLGRGICVRAPAPIGRAVVRALVVQLGLRFSMRQIAFAAEDPASWGLRGLAFPAGRRRGPFVLGIATEDHVDADAHIWLCASDADVPGGVTTVIDCTEPARAVLRTPAGAREISVECLSAEQAEAVAARRSATEQDAVIPDALRLDELTADSVESGLRATIARGEEGDVVVDIVEDGPHAIVVGITGTGKSELLVTWVTAIAAAHGPEDVVFVLADFKGGTAFEPLRALPHVVAVITDLDEEGARRGVSSLTAELRRREGILAAAGVRDIRQRVPGLPRLVVVVDEFAALLQEHPDLGAVFTDVAARGRALGMHLIVGTQRASGVVRDALAANCPLRLSLRVSDPTESRLVLGSPAAAELPGGAVGRGLAMIRRPTDEEPLACRVALTDGADLARVAELWSAADAPSSPWLPALPAILPLADLGTTREPDQVLFGLGDDPEHQAQPCEVLRIGADRGMAIVGGSGSGKSSALRLLAAQYPDPLWIPRDPEAAWDVVEALAAGASARLVLCDDLDALLTAFPGDYAALFAQRWDQILRGGAATTVVLTASRVSGATGRLLDALPRRAILRTANRLDHLGMGGEASGFSRERSPGRARLGSREVQIAWVPDEVNGTPGRTPGLMPGRLRRTGRRWAPRTALTGVVSSGRASVVAAFAAAHPESFVASVGTEAADASSQTILVGDAEAWQRHWSTWQRVRAEGEILVRAEGQAELRQLAGVRESPPFARLHAGRAWSIRDGGPPERVIVTALAPARPQSAETTS